MVYRFFFLYMGYALIAVVFVLLLKFGLVKTAIFGLPALLLLRLFLRWRPGRGYIFYHSRSDNTIMEGILTKTKVTRQETPIRFYIMFFLELSMIAFFVIALISKVELSEFPDLDRFIQCEVGKGIHDICFL